MADVEERSAAASRESGMSSPAALAAIDESDERIVERVLGGERELYEVLIRRHNQRVYRIARSVLGDEDEAEDVMQDAYVRAYAHLDQFEGRAKFSTWLGKIAVYEALARARRRGRFVEWDETTMTDDAQAGSDPRTPPTPEDELGRRELGYILTEAVDALAAPQRLVFVLRQIEGLSTAEAAECLGISEDNVKVRLHRARRALRRSIDRRIGESAPELYAFHLSRCDRIVQNVFARLAVL